LALKKKLFKELDKLNYDLQFQGHAEAILIHDFPDVADGLDKVVADFKIKASELIAGGGGESGPTQRLRRSLVESGWHKHVFNITKTVDGETRELSTHEIDHFWKLDTTAIALELEWNNKDTFFDRDLENFKRLHIDSAISIGIIITRGKTFHDNLSRLVEDYCRRHGINSFEDLEEAGITRTSRQTQIIQTGLDQGKAFGEVFSKQFVADKFGEATTHWRKLQERVARGAGGSCPLVLIGWSKDIIQED
jgi:hypothetical protein